MTAADGTGGGPTPLLLTPGPLTTTARVKRAMRRDWGSRDDEFTELTNRIRRDILAIAGAAPEPGGKPPAAEYRCVPLQGSGTFAVEAMIASLVAPEDGIVILANGAYGTRMAEICARLRLRHHVLDFPDDCPLDPARVRAALAERPDLRFVAMVHCETTSGLLNPVEAIADLCRDAGRPLLIDAMSSFGALPCDAGRLGFAALAASSNKCLQGVPGLSFVICRTDHLSRKDHTCPSLVLDLAAQDRQFSADGQWRFTPPTHVVAALAEALAELAEEGGPEARRARYDANCTALLEGMAGLGFSPALKPQYQAPIIVSFVQPADAWFDFETFYARLKDAGFAIYSGKMKAQGTFRVGVIGDVHPADIADFVAAAGRVIAAMQADH